MGRERRPRLLGRPQLPLARRSIIGIWPQGNLKCYWSHMVMSYEERAKRLKKGIKWVILILMIIFIIPIALSYLLYGLKYSFSTWGLIIGLPMSLLFAGVPGGYSIYLINKGLKRNSQQEIFSHWRKVGEKAAKDSLRRYMVQCGHPYRYLHSNVQRIQNSTYRQDIYKFQNGVQIRASYVPVHDRPIGSLMIRYPDDAFDFVLELQIDIDEFMYKEGTLKRKGETVF